MIESDYTSDFSAARKNMVEHQIRCCKILDGELLDMLERMPREAFLPENMRMMAFMEGHAPLACGQEMLTPLQEATILQQLQLRGDERVLLVGAGSGFLAMLLAMKAKHVTACDIHAQLVEIARNNLSAQGIGNVDVIQLNAMDAAAVEQSLGDGTFDVLVVAAAIDELPPHLAKRVSTNGGQCITFIGHNPLVTLQHELLQGEACVRTPLMETTLSDIEGLPQKRTLDF